jgi:NAD(P)-dependent dehydrogenase (short-subunit alcohol dehydrogenase family)
MSAAPNDLTGRVCVVTGPTSGIGRETARALARLHATLALVARDRERVDALVRDLKAESGNPRIEPFVADLSVLSEVRRVSEEIRQAYPKVHVLVNNAGALFFRREPTREGIERTWALNVLSPFLLTHRLCDRLVDSAPARVVNVASAAHRGGHLRLDDPERKAKYSGYSAYSQSKLALIMWTYELARRLNGTGVTVNALHPGFVATRFGQNDGGIGAAGSTCSATSMNVVQS